MAGLVAIVGLLVRDVCVAEYLVGLVGFVGLSRVTCGLLLSVQLVSSREADLPVFVPISWFSKSRPQFVLKIVFASKRQKQ